MTQIVPFFRRPGITIYQGNCLDVMPSLPSESVDLTRTDPPYLVGYEGRWDSDRKQIACDKDPTWLVPAFAEIYRLLKPDSFCVSFYGWPHADSFLGAWKSVGFRPVSHLAFVKRQWGLGRFTRGKHETAYLLAKGRPPKPKSAIADVIDWRREKVKWHPNQKPVAALSSIVKAFCPPCGIVLDPFMGSGSVLYSADELDLPAIGIEIEEEYCLAAKSRLTQLPDAGEATARTPPNKRRATP